MKGKRISRIILLMMLFCLILGGTAITTRADEVQPEERQTEDGLWYMIIENEVMISGYTGSAEQVEIPSMIENLPVTKIGAKAFQKADCIEAVIIPDTVKEIGNMAFSDCSGLKRVEIPASVVKLGNMVFQACTSLSGVTLPSGLKEMGQGVFWKCSSLTSIAVPNGVSTLEYAAFEYCSNLKSIVIPSGVTDIKEEVFHGCRDLLIFCDPETYAAEYAKEKNIPTLPEFYAYNPFTDVPDGKYYTIPVLWAVHSNPQITSGWNNTEFNPGGNCTRAQVVTFLWRKFGCPEPKTKTMPFTDVASGKYYYDAVLWAMENGITAGRNANTFAPNEPCSRADFVTFLWRAYDKPEVQTDNPFVDVDSSKYYAKAVLWAYKNRVTSGIDSQHFLPTQTLSRGQAVSFLYRTVRITEK